MESIAQSLIPMVQSKPTKGKQAFINRLARKPRDVVEPGWCEECCTEYLLGTKCCCYTTTPTPGPVKRDSTGQMNTRKEEKLNAKAEI